MRSQQRPEPQCRVFVVPLREWLSADDKFQKVSIFSRIHQTGAVSEEYDLPRVKLWTMITHRHARCGYPRLRVSRVTTKFTARSWPCIAPWTKSTRAYSAALNDRTNLEPIYVLFNLGRVFRRIELQESPFNRQQLHE